MNSEIGGLYSSVVTMVSSPVNALILLSIGYELKLDLSIMKDVITVSGIRLAIMSAITVIILTAGGSLINSEQLRAAVLFYAVIPPAFITPMFIRDAEESAFAATTLSFYTIITIAGYVILAAMFA